MSKLTTVNTLLARYVLRFLDSDAGRKEPMSATDERALADRVAEVADGIRARADRRERPDISCPVIDQSADSAP